MKIKSILNRSIILSMVFLFLLTGCGQEKPPVNYDPPVINNDPVGNDQSYVDTIPENNGNSKPIDIRPAEGVHISAEENAFWQDTVITFEEVSDSTQNIQNIDQKLYDEEGLVMLGGFAIDAGLSDDEYIPGVFDVEYDLSRTKIDPKYYEYLRIYRVGDNGEYYELTADIENNVLKFSSNQNSVFLACLAIEGLMAIGTVGLDEYLKRNVYFIKNGNETLRHDGKNIYGSWCIEWSSNDIDPDLGKKLKRMKEIERNYVKEAEKKYREDEMYFATNQMVLNQMMCDYILDSIKKDEEHKKLSEQIEYPDAIKKIDSYIDNAYRYLRGKEYMRMPRHQVPFKLIRDTKKYYGLANNRTLSSGYIDINLNYVNPAVADDMYNLQMTLAHELLHLCQVRYRFPIDAVSDNTRYDEMVAQMMEADALAYFKFKDIIPESANPDLTRSDFWGNLRLPINGEEDSNVDQEEIINCGYNLGGFLRYLIDKTGKRPWVHTIMKARSYLASDLSEPLINVFEIDERTFDLYFRNWIISNRSDIAKQSLQYVMSGMYGLEASTIMKKGGKYYKDFIHGSSYFLNLRCFEISKEVKDLKVILVPDKELTDVFPSANLGTGLEHKNITAGQFFDKLYNYSNTLDNLVLPVLEIQGDASMNDRSRNAGYTIYVLDKTPKAQLEIKDDKLLIRLPDPEPVAKDGVADGYILKLTTGKGKVIEKEIPKEYFGKILEMNTSELYDKEDTGEELNVKATLNEFFLDGDGNKILGIESDDAETESGAQQCELLIVWKGATYKISLEGAIVYGENPKGLIYCQAKPGATISIGIVSSDGSGIQLHNGNIIQSGSKGQVTIGTDTNNENGCWIELYAKRPGTDLYIDNIVYLVVYAVNEFTEKPIWSYEPSWSGYGS